MVHLWEVDHPYYCSESNYYTTLRVFDSNEPGERYDSWQEFHNDWGALDMDMNLLFRWDWKTVDRRDYEEGEAPGYTDYLELFFMLQRKGLFLRNKVIVTREDEPAVREYLAGYAAHMKLLWEPF